MSLLQVFSEMTTHKNGFGQNSCAADEQACVFGSIDTKESVGSVASSNPGLWPVTITLRFHLLFTRNR